MTEDITKIAKHLTAREMGFLRRIEIGELAVATREEDRARQTVRKLGLAVFNRQAWRWEHTPLGLAVRDYLKEHGHA